MTDEEERRLKLENVAAGELLHEIAVELGCINSSRESILFVIANLKEKAGRRDMSVGEGRSAQIVRNIASEIGVYSLLGAPLDERLVDRIKDLMSEIRSLRLLRDRAGRNF